VHAECPAKRTGSLLHINSHTDIQTAVNTHTIYAQKSQI